jgi:hypothetical protein
LTADKWLYNLLKGRILENNEKKFLLLEEMIPKILFSEMGIFKIIWMARGFSR